MYLLSISDKKHHKQDLWAYLYSSFKQENFLQETEEVADVEYSTWLASVKERRVEYLSLPLFW